MAAVVSTRISRPLARVLKDTVRHSRYRSTGALVRDALEKFLAETAVSRRRLIAEIAAAAVVANRPEVVDVVLFGSVAQDMDGKESDVDLLILVRGGDDGEAMKRVIDAVYPIELGSGVAVTPIVITREDFLEMVKRRSPFAVSVCRDGVQLFGGVLTELRRLLGESPRGNRRS